MDFGYSDVETAIQQSASAIFAPRSARLTDADRSRTDVTSYDDVAWRLLAHGDSLGLGLGTDVGGTGLTLVELCVLLVEQGRHLIRIPTVETCVVSGPAIDTFGTPRQRATLLPPVITGHSVIVAALAEMPHPAGDRSAVTASALENEWVLDGRLHCVPFAADADQILVPATIGGTQTMFIVDPASDGVRCTPMRTTDGTPEYQVDLAGVRCGADSVLGGLHGGERVHRFMLDRAVLGTCAVQVGVIAEALTMTAEHVSGREQFGRPLATFQAVTMRMADAYIDVECCRAAMWQAAWDLSHSESADESLCMAKYWCSEAARQVVASAGHLHGGLGVDKAYPLHRYVLHAKRNELAYGAATAQLARLGNAIATRGK